MDGEKAPWGDLSAAQLKDALVRRGLDTDGEMQEVIKRLQDYDSSRGKSNMTIAEPSSDALECSQPVEESENPLDTDLTLDTDQPLDADQALDADLPLDVDQALDADQPLDTDKALDTDLPLDTDQALDADQPLDTDLPLDTDQALDADHPLDTDLPLDTDQALDADQALDTNCGETEEDALKTDEDDDVIVMTDQEIQAIIDQPDVDMTDENRENTREISPDCITLDDEEGGNDASSNAENPVNDDKSSEKTELKSEDGKKEEKKADSPARKESESRDKEDDKDKPYLIKNRMLYGYLCCNAVKSLIITPFKTELMREEAFITWVDQASSFNISKTPAGTSAVYLRFPTLDKGDSACCALKSKLATLGVEVYHPNKDIFSNSRNSWTNLMKDVHNPQETLFNRLVICETVPETYNTDEKLCELFPEAIDVVSFQFDPECSGIAVAEFFDMQITADFIKKNEGQLEIEGKKYNIYKYDKKHHDYLKKHYSRTASIKQKEIPPLSDDERKEMTEEYKKIKAELEILQNSEAYFAVEKVARFVELDNRVNEMVRILTNDTTIRFSRDWKAEMPEGEDNMLTCVRNTISKMKCKIITAKGTGTYNESNEGSGSNERRGEHYSSRGGGWDRDGENRRFSRNGSPPHHSRFPVSDGGWRTMSRDRGGHEHRDRGSRRDRSPGGYRRDRSPGYRQGHDSRHVHDYKHGRGGSYRREHSPAAHRRDRSPGYRRERSPVYRREGRGDFSRGWSPQDRRARSPGGYRRGESPQYGGSRGWSPEYRHERGPDYNRPRENPRARSPVYPKLEDKDFRPKSEGPNPTSKVLQEFTAVLADKVRSLEQLQQQTLQAHLLQGGQVMGANPIPNPSVAANVVPQNPIPNPSVAANMGAAPAFTGTGQAGMYGAGYNMGGAGRM